MCSIRLDMRMRTTLLATTVANRIAFRRTIGSSRSHLFSFRCLSSSPLYLGPVRMVNWRSWPQ